MVLLESIIDDFIKLTKYNVRKYLTDYALFMDNHSKNIIDLYLGNTTLIDDDGFNLLDNLLDEKLVIDGLVNLNKNSFNLSVAYWDLLEMLTDIGTSLLTHKNAQKWTRSSITKSRLSEGTLTEVMLKMFQTLENVSKQIGSSDKEEYWLQVALNNDLREEDYTTRGGTSLKVRGSNRAGIRINSVVDVDIIGEKIYGIDISKKIQFNQDEDDLVILGYQDTLLQTVEILSSLKRGDTPEFEEEGFQSSLVAGSNRASISFPILLRQYYNTFSKDDSFKSILFKNIEVSQDSLSISLECTTRINETKERILEL